MKKIITSLVLVVLLTGCVCPIPPGHTMDENGFLVPLQTEKDNE